MHINSLPALPLRIIFSKLSLQDVLQLGRVCLLWQSYQQEIVSKVNSITLLVGKSDPATLITRSFFHIKLQDKLVKEDGSPMYVKARCDGKWFHVRYSLLGLDTVKLLVATLPNMATLQIAINQISYEVLEQIIWLVHKWRSSLITLKLWFKFCQEDGSPDTGKVILLLSAINSLTLLEHLTVDIEHLLYPFNSRGIVNDQFEGIKPHFELSILSRLHEFYFCTLDRIDRTPLFYSLKHFVPVNARLTRIGLGNFDKHRMYLWFALHCPSVASKITSLPCVDWDNDLELDEDPLQAQRHFAQFTSITEVSFCHFAHYHKFSQLINSFSPLNQLVRLHIDLHLRTLGTENRRALPLSRDDSTPQSRIHQLSSVKILSLSLYALKHSDLESKHWAWAFPNVQILNFYHQCVSPHARLPSLMACTHYAHLSNNLEHISQDQLLTGLQQMLHTFVQCPKLRLIFTHDPVPIEWTVVETDGQKHILKVLKA